MRGKPAARDLVQTQIGLPAAVIQALDDQASREGVYSRSAIVRRACAEYLARAGHSPQQFGEKPEEEDTTA